MPNEKIWQVKVGDNIYDIDLPNDATPEIAGLTVNGDISEGGNFLKNKYAPYSHGHAYLPLSGGTISGNLKVTGSITEGSTTLSQKYAAKSHTHSYLPLSGGTLTGALTLSVINTNSTYVDFRKTISVSGDIQLTGDIDYAWNSSKNTCWILGSKTVSQWPSFTLSTSGADSSYGRVTFSSTLNGGRAGGFTFMVMKVQLKGEDNGEKTFTYPGEMVFDLAPAIFVQETNINQTNNMDYRNNTVVSQVGGRTFTLKSGKKDPTIAYVLIIGQPNT